MWVSVPPSPGDAGLTLPSRGDAVDVGGRHLSRRRTQRTAARWVLGQPGQPGAHHLHGDALLIGLGEVEDVAGEQLDGLDHAHGVDCRPPIAEVVENHVCGDGKCKTD